MKKVVLAALIVASTNAFASGIPVVDVVANANMLREIIQNAIHFKEQITTARDQYEQIQNDAKYYSNMVEGTTGWYKNNFRGLNNLNDVIKDGDWLAFYNSIDGSKLNALRHKYNMIASEGEDSPQQAVMDTMLKELAIQDEMYSHAVDRNNRLTDLKSQLEKANTPKKRDELSNAIQLEGMQMQNDQQLLTAMTSMQHTNAEQERRQAYKRKVHNLYSQPTNN